MTISTLTQLKTAIDNWTHRTDLTSYTEDFINLGESRLNRELRLLQMETTASVSITSANDYATLPTGFLEQIDLWYPSDNTILTKLTPVQLQALYTDTTGRPERYTITYRYQFDQPADANYTLTSRHYKAWDLITDTSNWLLTNYPDAYLFCALAETEPFLKNDKRVLLWEQKAQRAIDELNKQDMRARRTPLRADAALVSSGVYDIFTDR